MQRKYITEQDTKIRIMETKYKDINMSSSFKKINSGLEETLVEKKKNQYLLKMEKKKKKTLTLTIYPNTLISIAELKLM